MQLPVTLLQFCKSYQKVSDYLYGKSNLPLLHKNYRSSFADSFHSVGSVSRSWLIDSLLGRYCFACNLCFPSLCDFLRGCDRIPALEGRHRRLMWVCYIISNETISGTLRVMPADSVSLTKPALVRLTYTFGCLDAYVPQC